MANHWHCTDFNFALKSSWAIIKIQLKSNISESFIAFIVLVHVDLVSPHDENRAGFQNVSFNLTFTWMIANDSSSFTAASFHDCFPLVLIL
jgi:hypothetical protein